MPPPPLTHHQILGLLEPFTRSGRQLDLAASDRLARTLQFKPVGHAADGNAPALTDTLQLQCHASGNHRLTRVLTLTLTLPQGQNQAQGMTQAIGLQTTLQTTLQATLQAMGTDLARVLAQVDAVPLARHWDAGPGWCAAKSFEVVASAATPAAGALPALSFVGGQVQLDGLLFGLRVMDVKNVAGDITLRPAPGERPALPEDLLAVIGWNWARLVPRSDGWTSKLRLRGKGPARCRAAERALGQAARHLAQVLAAPPAHYHPQQRWARWGVVLRRGIPSLTALGLVAGALMLPRFAGQELSGVWMALHYVPIAVLALSFTLQELPRFELPPLPRRLRAAQWRSAPGTQVQPT